MTVSRHGLTRCPHCRTYVRVSDDACIGCGADLDESPAEGALSTLRRGFARTRGGIIAASLLGLSTLWGCGDDDAPSDARSRDVAPELSAGDAAYGLPPFDLTVDKPTDVPQQQEAGVDSGGDAGAD